MTRLLVSLLLAASIAFPASSQVLDGWEECLSAKPEVAIPGCERFLKSAKSKSGLAAGHFLRGNAYLARREFDNALADYDSALQIDPRDVKAMTNRGVVLGMMGRSKDALQQLDEAVNTSPNDPTVFSSRGVAHVEAGDYNRAHADFSKAIELKPDSVRALTHRAEIERVHGRIPEALADADRAVEIDPRDAEARIVRAILLAIEGKSEEAIADLAAAIKSDPDNGEPYNFRGVVQARRGEHTAAIDDFNAALKRDLNYASALYNRGYTYERMGKYDLAIADYDAALRLDVKFLAAYAARGLLKERQGKQDNANEDFLAADKLQPANDDISRMAMNTVADALAKAKHPRGAPGRYTVKDLYSVGLRLVGPLPEVKDVLSSGPQPTADASAGSRETDDSAGDTPSAPEAAIDLDPEMEQASEALGLGPRFARGYAIRAKELLAKRRTDEAFVDANRAVALAPQDAVMRVIRAELHSARGNPDAAIADLTVAIGIALSDPEPLNARGVVLARRGDFVAAMADFDASLEIEGGAYKYALYNRAYVSEKLGKNDDALKDYDAAISSDPKFLAAIAMRGLLKEKLGQIDDAVTDFKVARTAEGDDDISRKAANLVADAEHQPHKAPGRYSFYSLENVGIALIGPLPENGDFLQRQSDDAAESVDDKESTAPDQSSGATAAQGAAAPTDDTGAENAVTGGRQNLLGSDEVYELLKGNTSDGVMLSGGPYKEFYAADGTIHGKSYEGTWWMKDDEFCTSYPGMKSDCYGVRKEGNGAINWVIDGRVVGYGRVISGNHYDY